MTARFLYGPLCHAPLRAAVLGRDVPVRPARLDGHAVQHLPEGAGLFGAGLVAAAGSTVEGLLAEGLGPDGALRLDLHNGGAPLRRCTVLTAEGPVQALASWPEAGTGGAPWQASDWECAAAGGVAAGAVRAAQALMAGLDGPEAARRNRAMHLGRVAARARAAAGGPTTLRRRAGPDDVALAALRTPYAAFFAVEEADLSFRRFDGSMSPTVTRAAFVMADAVTVLPYDPGRDRVLVIEQFRAGAWARGDAQPWSLEPIAGRIDAGEGPEAAARREAEEEAGLALGALLPVGRYYPSPGAVSEYLYSYVALADLPDAAAGVGGLASEAEDIRSHVIGFERLMALVESGEVENGPLILTALWLSRQRDGLRRGA